MRQTLCGHLRLPGQFESVLLPGQAWDTRGRRKVQIIRYGLLIVACSWELPLHSKTCQTLCRIINSTTRMIGSPCRSTACIILTAQGKITHRLSSPTRQLPVTSRFHNKQDPCHLELLRRRLRHSSTIRPVQQSRRYHRLYLIPQTIIILNTLLREQQSSPTCLEWFSPYQFTVNSTGSSNLSD